MSDRLQVVVTFMAGFAQPDKLKFVGLREITS
jgi:hypothetical protein